MEVIRRKKILSNEIKYDFSHHFSLHLELNIILFYLKTNGELSGRFPFILKMMKIFNPECSVTWFKFILNHIKLSLTWIVIKLFRLIWHQTGFRLVTNQLEKCDHNPNLVKLNTIQNPFLRVYNEKVIIIFVIITRRRRSIHPHGYKNFA